VISNYDLKWMSKVITTNPTSLGLGAVPSTLKRYVTFVRVENRFGGDNTLFVVSVATETYASTPARASARAKMRFLLDNGGQNVVPIGGPTKDKNPLFSIASDAYLNALTDQGECTLEIQYFEEE
jgi:hypothetical protein